MIKNERQYRITRAEAEKFRRVLAKLAAGAGRQGQLHPRLARAEREALQSQLDDLQQEIREYEDLKAGKVSIIDLDSLGELPNGLIKARVASGLSQKGLAELLGLKEQQIQKYEAEGYSSASFQRLKEISDAMGVRIRERIQLPEREDREAEH
jgi:ribosome-binding protein aMBF1 (putative translation factor)